MYASLKFSLAKGSRIARETRAVPGQVRTAHVTHVISGSQVVTGWLGSRTKRRIKRRLVYGILHNGVYV